MISRKKKNAFSYMNSTGQAQHQTKNKNNKKKPGRSLGNFFYNEISQDEPTLNVQHVYPEAQRWESERFRYV